MSVGNSVSPTQASSPKSHASRQEIKTLKSIYFYVSNAPAGCHYFATVSSLKVTVALPGHIVVHYVGHCLKKGTILENNHKSHK